MIFRTLEAEFSGHSPNTIESIDIPIKKVSLGFLHDIFKTAVKSFSFEVESREAITLRPSHLDPDVRLSPHPAPDKLDFFSLAHVDVLVTAMVDCH